MSKILIALAILSFIGLSTSTVCRDGSQCPGTSTCCLTPQGVGCCPYENASCCSDGVHCCPNGYQCDLSGGRCVKSSLAHNDFLTFHETVEFREEMALQNLTTSTPKVNNVDDILKCIKDIGPIVADVKNIVDSVKNKKIAELVKDVIQIEKDGKQLYSDCWKSIQSGISNISFMELDEATEPTIKGLLPTGASDLLTCINDVQPVVSDIYNIGKCVASSDKECLQKWVDQITADGSKLVADCKKVIQ
jgi:hypothetical protein